jgi:exosortase/archaeosortase family protein
MSFIVMAKRHYFKYKEEISFVTKVVFLFLFIKIFFHVMGEEKVHLQDRMFPAISAIWEQFNNGLRFILLHTTSCIFILLGYQTNFIDNYTVLVNGLSGVSIGNYCLGIQLWLYFSALIIAYPGGKWKKKLVFIFVGILCINLLNISRFIGLIYVAAYKPNIVDLAHEYIFNYIIYAFSIFMLYLWIKRFN